MTKKFKKSVALGSQIAPLDMAWFTYWYQSKNDFFGPSLVLTPLIALETPKNLWKHMAICQYLTQDTKSTKFEPFGRFFSFWNDLNQTDKWVEKSRFCLFFIFHPFYGFRSNWKSVQTIQHIKICCLSNRKCHFRSLWPDFIAEKGQIYPLKRPEISKKLLFL